MQKVPELGAFCQMSPKMCHAPYAICNRKEWLILNIWLSRPEIYQIILGILWSKRTTVLLLVEPVRLPVKDKVGEDQTHGHRGTETGN